MPLPLVGIIANPASGRDIRRLVAHGTVFDNNEKTAIVRRVLLGMEAIGMVRVAYMPEHDFGIVPRALSVKHGQTPAFSLEAFPLSMPVTGTSSDLPALPVCWPNLVRVASSRSAVMVPTALLPKAVVLFPLFLSQQAPTTCFLPF